MTTEEAKLESRGPYYLRLERCDVKTLFVKCEKFHWFLGICPQIKCFRFNQNDRFTRERTQIGMLRTKHCKSFAFTAWFIVKNLCKQPFWYSLTILSLQYLWLKVSIINQRAVLFFFRAYVLLICRSTGEIEIQNVTLNFYEKINFLFYFLYCFLWSFFNPFLNYSFFIYLD